MALKLWMSLVHMTILLAFGTLCTAQDFNRRPRALASASPYQVGSSVAVTDFTDLDGKPTKLGRFLAEEFSDALFSQAKGFDVIDRTHLKVILQEHKLATTGLIDPATARQLGQVAGVETLVTGTITPFEEHVHLSLKVLDTETAKLIAASTYDVPKTKTITDLMSSEERGPSGNAVPAQTLGMTPRDLATPTLPAPVTRDELLFISKGCRNTGSKTKCVFSVTNKSDLNQNVTLDYNTFLVDDQGNQYKHFDSDWVRCLWYKSHSGRSGKSIYRGLERTGLGKSYERISVLSSPRGASRAICCAKAGTDHDSSYSYLTPVIRASFC